MVQLAFSKLGLKKPKEVVELELFGNRVEVKQFIPTFDKIRLVSSAVKSSVVDGMVNEMIMEAALHYLIIVEYTNIAFTEKQEENMMVNYDLMDANGIIDAVVQSLPEGEYDFLFRQCLKQAEQIDRLTRSSVQGLSGQMEANRTVEEFLEKTTGSIKKGSGSRADMS